MPILLLDGDIIAYKFATVAESPIDWGHITTLHAFPDEAAAAMDNYIEKLKTTLDCSKIVIALSDDKENFRKNILPTYKENRVAVRKPIILFALRQHLRDHYDVWERPTLEGDDILGILATSKKILKGEKIIVSIDKDMKSIPCKLYNTAKPDDGVMTITEDEADYFHMIQTLTGDSSDGFSGCPGIGPKRAEQILSDSKGQPEKLWSLVVETYEKAKLSEEEALRQARVARILRASDYDFKRKKPILWKPRLKD